MKRISYLDGHRGIAILLVILFHAYSRWTEIVPYQADYADFPLFKYGYLGVQLFFLISGFVILMTLEKCTNIREFIFQRWLRLFPAMLVCSIILFITSGYFFERPNGLPTAKDLLPGLTFVEPYVWGKLTGVPFNNLENAFWSLYVEFKFYVIAAFLYFLIGSRYLVITLFTCFIAWFLTAQLNEYTDNRLISYLWSIFNLLGFKYFGWFSAGSAFYMFTKDDNKSWYQFGLSICIINSAIIAFNDNSKAVFVAIMIISLFFAISLVSSKLQALISNKFMLFLGYISYPLYLLHENMMISITIQFEDYIPKNLSFLLPIIAISFISVIALVVAKFVERPIKMMIKKVLSTKWFAIS